MTEAFMRQDLAVDPSFAKNSPKQRQGKLRLPITAS